VSVTALRDDQGAIIGYLLIGTDNTARKAGGSGGWTTVLVMTCTAVTNDWNGG
jgi:hypothetical protein